VNWNFGVVEVAPFLLLNDIITLLIGSDDYIVEVVNSHITSIDRLTVRQKEAVYVKYFKDSILVSIDQIRS
jgi:hypothetical protein